MTLRFAVVAVLTLSTASVAFAAPPPRADALLRAIETRGARAVVSELFALEDRWSAVLLEIETGRSEWLEVARRLKPASDAASSLGLNYSVARALLAQPERVLALIGRGFAVNDICTSPFIEPESGVAERYEKRALQVLARLERAGLAHAAECAAQVRLP